MLKKVLIALGAFAILGAAIPASAQESKPLNLSIRAGAFFPGSDAARDESNTWFLIGAEFKIQDLPASGMTPEMRAMLTLSADYITGGDFSVVPVMLNYVDSRNEWFWSAGAGFSFADFQNNNDTLFTWSLAFGCNFQQGASPVFIEAKYYGTSDADANGFAVSLGVRV